MLCQMIYTIEVKWLINSLNKYLLSVYYESSSILDIVCEAMKKIIKIYFILELETSTGRNNINK